MWKFRLSYFNSLSKFHTQVRDLNLDILITNSFPFIMPQLCLLYTVSESWSLQETPLEKIVGLTLFLTDGPCVQISICIDFRSFWIHILMTQSSKASIYLFITMCAGILY